MNLAECKTIGEVGAWVAENRDYPTGYVLVHKNTMSEALHQAELIGVRLGIEAAAQFTLTHIPTPLGGTMKHGTKADDGSVDMAYAIRALDAAAIVKKGM